MSEFVVADPYRYLNWLEIYMRQGGEPTVALDSSYDKAIDRGWFVTATRDFETYGESAASSRMIMVPLGVQYLGGEIGCNSLFFEYDEDDKDGWRHVGKRVPVFANDARFLVIEGMHAWIDSYRQKCESTKRKGLDRVRQPLAAMQRGDPPPDPLEALYAALDAIDDSPCEAAASSLAGILETPDS